MSGLRRLLTVAAVAATAAGACLLWRVGEEPRPEAIHLLSDSVAFAGAWAGEFHPCECGERFTGGVARAATVWKRSGAGVAIGPLFSRDEILLESERQALSGVLAEAGVRAYGVSRRDTTACGSIPRLGRHVIAVALNVEGAAPSVQFRASDGTELTWTHVAAPRVRTDLAGTFGRLRALLDRTRDAGRSVVVTSELSSGDLAHLLEVVGDSALVIPFARVTRTPTPIVRFGARLIVPGERGVDAVRLRGRGTAWSADLLELGASVDRDPPSWSRIQEMYRQHAALGVSSLRLVDPDQTTASRSCAQCHADATERWRATPHAHAWEHLPDYRRGDPRCASCHTTPVPGDEAGPLLERGVQCSACHEVPESHREAGRGDVTTRLTCTRCHDQENAPNFELETALQRVACPPSMQGRGSGTR